MKKTILLIVLFFSVSISIFSQNIFHKKTIQMGGTAFEYYIEATDKIIGEGYIEMAIKEVDKIYNIISSKNYESETNKINKNAGIKAVKVSKEMIDIINKTIKVSDFSHGHFDITYKSINYKNDISDFGDNSFIESSLGFVNYKNIEIDEKESTVFLKKKGMKIGLGAVDRGSAIEYAKKKLQSIGVKSGFINAGGDITYWGKHPKNKKWSTYISQDIIKIISNYVNVKFDNNSIVTAGSLKNSNIKNGKSHFKIINPKSGSLVSGVQSVTIFCFDAEIADALATTVYILGITDGIKLLEKIDNVKYLIFDEEGIAFTSK